VADEKNIVNITQKNGFVKTAISKPEKWLLNAAFSIGLDYSILTHEITTDLFIHSMKRHGDPEKHGKATIKKDDFDYINEIIRKPDFAVIGAIRKTKFYNTYVKILDNITYIYFEEMLISRKNKALRGKTLYKVARPLTLYEAINIIVRNNKTDISKAKILN